MSSHVGLPPFRHYLSSDETIFANPRNHPETSGLYPGPRYWGETRGFPMFELTTAFIAAFSVSIFLAHTVEAYLAR
jgi:hypothetical protein